jgi:hypothetical protein
MRAITSVPLKAVDPQTVLVPGDAGSLGIRLAGDTPTWTLVGEGALRFPVTVRRVGEGGEVGAAWRYLGHTQEQVGAPVWYWFVEKGSP